MNDRDKAELYRAIGEQFLRSPELHQMLATPFVGVAEAVAAWVEQMDRQTLDLDVVAAFDAQLAEMSRGIASALLDTHMAIISIPRVEIFSETLDQVARIEIPYNPQLMPSPVGGMAAPTTQSDPDRAQSILEQTIAGIIAGLVVLAFQLAIVWYAQTGRWEFEELLAYFVQVVLQHLDWPLDPSIPPPS